MPGLFPRWYHTRSPAGHRRHTTAAVECIHYIHLRSRARQRSLLHGGMPSAVFRNGLAGDHRPDHHAPVFRNRIRKRLIYQTERPTVYC